MFGTGGEEIARRVAKELNYAYYGEKELYNAASEMGFLMDIKKLDEKSPAFLDRFFSERPKIYLDRLQSVIYEVAKKGNAVFFGRGSQLLLQSFDCAFHVLVTGSMEKRIKRVIEENQAARGVVERMVHQSDHDKRGFIRFAFDEDWLNPRLYDLILNTDKLSVDAASKMIVEGAWSEEIKSCGIDSVANLRKLSIQRQIESGLLESDLMSSRLFFTTEDGETVRFFGFVDSQEEKEKVEALAKKVKDIKKVENDLVIMRSPMSGA
jgi:cytidylate kinase